ncbi:MAG: ComF family protein [Saprospiraceae bacterium]|nr:ComF family protein [Saprospiraceae bacterium]
MTKNFVLRKLMRPWDDFLNLLFPRLCLACNEPVAFDEAHICLDCQALLPETDFHLSKINDFTARFEGRLPVEAAAALFFFTKKSKTQHLIHQIKYQDKREAAFDLGRYYGQKLLQQPHFQGIDYLIPVPMHIKKRIQRGFNQAEIFANGLSETLNVPVNTSVLTKIKATETQTKKTRLERLKNAEDVFHLTDKTLLRDKKILIVDDVMTSGATLEGCANSILAETPTTKIYFVTLAIAKTT